MITMGIIGNIFFLNSKGLAIRSPDGSCSFWVPAVKRIASLAIQI